MISSGESSDDDARGGASAAAQARAGNGGTAVSAISTTVTVNGTTPRLTLDPRSTLLDVLRQHLDLTGAKKGCEQASAARAPCWSTDGASFHVSLWPS